MNKGFINDLERPEPLYAAFMIRCWREGEQWRFVLENVAMRERWGFDSLEDLSRFIQERLAGRDLPDDI